MKIFFCADTRNNVAQQKLRACIKRYGQANIETADVVVALGGDGFMLKTLQMLLNYQIPVFGLNFGHVGYLLNHYAPDQLPERIERATPVCVAPLLVYAEPFYGSPSQHYAFNDVSIIRQSPQAARLSVGITDVQDWKPIISQDTVFGDGLIAATTSGTSAYYAAAGGCPLPDQKGHIALKGSNCRQNYNPILSDEAHVFVVPQEPVKRPVQMDCDGKKRVSNIALAQIECAPEKKQTILVEKQGAER